MARSVRSKRRLRNQRVQVEKLKVFENNRLDEIISKREEHSDNQVINADALNIPPELAALNKSNDMQVEKPKEKENKKKNENVMQDDDDEESDEEMGDSTKVKKSNPSAHLSNKETKQKYIKQYIKKAKKRAQQKKKVKII